MPYQRGTIRQVSSLHSFLLNIGLVTVNASGHYKDAMEPPGVLVRIMERDRIVLHYWQDLREELPGATSTTRVNRMKVSAKSSSGPPIKGALLPGHSVSGAEYAKLRKYLEPLLQQKLTSALK